jgi:SAM-dependent methyltransferase
VGGAGDGRTGRSRVDSTVVHPARRYDYWLGGKDNFAVDRISGDEVARVFPTIRLAALENRRFLGRSVRYLSEHGIRQFLDIGTGLPTADNTHQVAQTVNHDARVVYVDNDPLVLAHARALLVSATEAGLTSYIDADLREPDKILRDPALRETLDLSQPVGLMLVAVLHFIQDREDPYRIVRTLVDALAPGSYVVISHATLDYVPASELAAAQDVVRHGPPMGMRSSAEVARFFDGLELVEPGIVSVADWHADEADTPRPAPAEVSVYAGVARKP